MPYRQQKALNEVVDDFWTLYEQREEGDAFVIPTNCSRNAKGHAVMGRGLALDASRMYTDLSSRLGKSLLVCQTVQHFDDIQLLMFPVKYQWYEKADLYLIGESCQQTNQLLADGHVRRVYIPHVGCGNGKLQWHLVRSLLERKCRGNYVIVTKEA